MRHIQKILVLASLMFKIWIKGDHLLFFFLIGIVISLVLVILEIQFQYFLIAFSVPVIYLSLLLNSDKSLQEKHFYRVMGVSNKEVYLTKFLYFFLLYALMLILLNYALRKLLFINAELWAVFIITIIFALLPLMIKSFNK